jgi:hypothetical protein
MTRPEAPAAGAKPFLRLTNVEPDGRVLLVLIERDGVSSSVMLASGAVFELHDGDRIIACRKVPKHFGISIDTLHMGVDGGQIG